MSRTVTTAALAALLAVSLLGAVPQSASGQEAIMLEQLGAVRMAQPAEIQRANTGLAVHASPARLAPQPERHVNSK